MTRPLALFFLSAFLLSGTALSGCTQSVEQGPGSQTATQTGPGVFQQTDQWSAPKAGDSRSYAWENPTGMGHGQFTGEVSLGQYTVRVLDADGKEVWSATANGPGQVAKQSSLAPGKPGTWHIVRDTTSLSGQITLQFTAA